VIVIKKYPNRRLYDTSKSQYVNLETIRELVMQHKDFKVIDSKTEDDLTKSILLQIISDQEASDQQAILTQTVLKQLIRFYGSDKQLFMRQYLEQSIAIFLERQETFHGVVQDFMDSSSPMNIFKEVVEKNMSLWQSFATGAADSAAKFTGTVPDSDDSPNPDQPKKKT